MRCQRGDGCHGPGRGAGGDQYDRKPVKEIRQRDERLVVLVASGSWLRERIGISVAIARIDDCIAIRGLRDPVGEIPPPRDRPQSLVQEDERGLWAHAVPIRL